MASLYTDESREMRYGRLRARRNSCEKWLGLIMWGILLISLLSLVPAFVDGLLGGLFRGELYTFFGFLFSVVNFCAAVYAVYAKKWKHTVLAMLVIAVLGSLTIGIDPRMAASGVYIIPLIPTVFIDRIWAGLEKEEGFPLFDISYAEREERRRNQEKLTEARALRAGVRAAQTEQTSDMSDLLDSGFDAPVMAMHPHGYHERYQDSQQSSVPMKEICSGAMDALEELGGSAPQTPAKQTAPVPSAGPAALAGLEAMDSIPVVSGRSAALPDPAGLMQLGEIGRNEAEALFERSETNRDPVIPQS